MPSIFISYRRADSAMAAGRIHDRLAAAFGHENVFKDVDDIPPGVDFRVFIAQEVQRSDVMLVLIGQIWLMIADTNGARRLDNPDDFVRIEVETGLNKDQCRVVPVLLGNTSLPQAQDLPESLQGLIYLNAAHVRDDPDFNRDVDRLIRWLRGGGSEFDVNAAIVEFYSTYTGRRWTSALQLLNKIRASGRAPRVFDVDNYEQAIRDQIELEEAEQQRQEWEETAKREYNAVQIMSRHEDLDRVWERWQVYCEQFADYDPDNLGVTLAQLIQAKEEAEKRERAYATLSEQVNRRNTPENLQSVWKLFRQQYGEYDPDNLHKVIVERLREKEETERREQAYKVIEHHIQLNADPVTLQSELEKFQRVYGDYDPEGFVEVILKRVLENEENEKRDRAYAILKKQVTKSNSPEILQTLLQNFHEQYGDHDPDNLAQMIAKELEKRKRIEQRDREYDMLRERVEQGEDPTAIYRAWTTFKRKFKDFDPDGLEKIIVEHLPVKGAGNQGIQNVTDFIERIKVSQHDTHSLWQSFQGRLHHSQAFWAFGGLMGVMLIITILLIGLRNNSGNEETTTEVALITETLEPISTFTNLPTPTPAFFTMDVEATRQAQNTAAVALEQTATYSSLSSTPKSQSDEEVPTGMAATPVDTPISTETPTPAVTYTFTPTATLISAGSLNAEVWSEPVIQEFDGVEMVYVPAGCFVILKKVCLDAFWIDRTEVTSRQFQDFNGQAAYESSTIPSQYPQVFISWTEAQAYCENRGGRLPTEAEWEYAARGPQGLIYPWGNEFIPDNVIYYQNSQGSNVNIRRVGIKRGGASWVGALDMSGNVWEWVADWYNEEYYATLSTGARNPTGPTDGTYRVIRGGSYNSTYFYTQATIRSFVIPSQIYSDTGFRCVISP